MSTVTNILRLKPYILVTVRILVIEGTIKKQLEKKVEAFKSTVLKKEKAGVS